MKYIILSLASLFLIASCDQPSESSAGYSPASPESDGSNTSAGAESTDDEKLDELPPAVEVLPENLKGMESLGLSQEQVDEIDAWLEDYKKNNTSGAAEPVKLAKFIKSKLRADQMEAFEKLTKAGEEP